MSECTLRITDLRETDSAEYKFRFKTQNAEWGYSFPGTTLTVTDLQVKVTPGKPKTKTLTCSTSCNLTDNSNLTYVWYMNGQRLDKPVSCQHSVKEYYTHSYSCSLLNLRSAVVCIVGQSCMNVSYTHQSVCALKGSTVNISCTFRHPNRQNVTETTWFNKWDSGVIIDLNQDPEYAGRVEYHRTTDKDSTLTVKDLRESDSAEYKFRFTTNIAKWGYSFPGTTLSVTDLQVKVTPATKEGNVTLTCSTSCPLTDHTTYIWHQNGQGVTNEHNNVLHLGLTTEDVGYSCAVKGHEDLRSQTITVRYEAVFPWVPVVTVGAVLTVAVLLVTIYCTMRRRSSGGSDAKTDPQSVHPDAMGDTRTALNLTTLSPDYDTLGSVHPDTNSNTYSSLNMKIRSPDYDTLDVSLL
uniref:Ig-like domain-containing protein n=1 Tax=Esox lucius TaxID=8010 RepID=A0AAY5K5K1_ESOLU